MKQSLQMELTAFHTMPTSLDPSLNITLEFFNFIYSEKKFIWCNIFFWMTHCIILS